MLGKDLVRQSEPEDMLKIKEDKSQRIYEPQNLHTLLEAYKRETHDLKKEKRDTIANKNERLQTSVQCCLVERLF